jgi:hypothetical protein
MTELTIELTEDRAGFVPGEEVSGTVSWSTEQTGEELQLRLFWFTRGKGTEDAGIVEKLQFDRPSPHETRPFRFRLPAGPYSFSGQLISLVWALELVASGSKTVVRREIEVGPDRREVRLESVRSPAGGGQSWLTIKTR